MRLYNEDVIQETKFNCSRIKCSINLIYILINFKDIEIVVWKHL